MIKKILALDAIYVSPIFGKIKLDTRCILILLFLTLIIKFNKIHVISKGKFPSKFLLYKSLFNHSIIIQTFV